ncbi:MAG: CmcJ/NvfI family oxidoreductase [Litorimonas sp.]
MKMISTPQELHTNMQISGKVTADLNYIKPDAVIAPEVFYSGGDAPQKYNEAYAFMPADINDCRSTAQDFKIHVQGFQIVNSPTSATSFDNIQDVEDTYYEEIKEIVKNTTGAKDVFVFDHTVRLGENNSRRKPAHHVHNDYTERTAVIRAKERIGDDQFAAMQGRRMIQINVWRPLVSVVRRSPLAFCDSTTIDAKDFLPTKIHFPDTDHIGEIYALRKNDNQRWSYFSEMTHDEVVLIKGFDSLKDGTSRFTPHTAFEYPDQDPNIGPRKSIETRTFAFY